jgi:hypothetical protein
MENNINLNQANCLVKRADFTETIIYNICNGETQFIPHSLINYVEAGLVVPILILLTIAIALLLKAIIFNEI